LHPTFKVSPTGTNVEPATMHPAMYDIAC